MPKHRETRAPLRSARSCAALLLVLVACDISPHGHGPPDSGSREGASSDDESFVSGGSRITVSLDPDLAQKSADVMHWVQLAADAITGYYGHFPVPAVHVVVAPRRGDPVNAGKEFNGERIVLHIDPRATADELNSDWTLVHEMFHIGFPSVGRDYHYMEEGLSDYLEPLARARAGNLSEQEVWKSFVEGMPQGVPRHGDGGLDGTHDWGLTYWGGCIFWMLVDLDAREQSHNSKSLDDAIRAIVAAGGTGDQDWPVEKVISVGDAAIGTGSLRKIHDLLGPRAVDPQLDAVWKRLGVQANGGRISFDDSAPLAAIRRSMTARVPRAP